MFDGLILVIDTVAEMSINTRRRDSNGEIGLGLVLIFAFHLANGIYFVLFLFF